MPQYYFDTFDGADWTRDDVGIDVEGSAEARKLAQLALADMVRDVLPTGNHVDVAVRIRDQADDPIGTVKLGIDSDPPDRDI